MEKDDEEEKYEVPGFNYRNVLWLLYVNIYC